MPLQKLVNFPIDTNFRVVCPEAPLMAELAQDVTIPSLSLPQAEVYNRFVDQPQPGEKIQFPEIDIGFSIDEYLDVYAEIWSWMSRMAGPPGMSQYEESERKVVVCDLEVIMLDNRMKEARRFIFHDAWPTNIGALSLDVGGDASAIKGIVTFEYLAMNITPADKNLTNLGDFNYNH